MIIWTVKPQDGCKLSIGDVLIPMDEFPKNDRLVRCRRQGEYQVACRIEGDGAVEIRRFGLPLPFLKVTGVSGISGYGKAVLRTESERCEQ